MSWPQWPGAAGVPQPSVVQAPLINPAPNVLNPAAALMPTGQYTPEQWAQMQQQNWQQWAQWQQQFQQWQQQYGAEYQKSITALAAQSRPAPVQPPVPFFNMNTNAPPPLPAETKPPPPPDEPQLGQPPGMPQYPTFTSAPPPIPQSNFNTAPPPQPPPPKDHFQNQFNPNQGNAPSAQGGFANRNLNEGFKSDSQQRFGGNQNYPNNNNNRGPNRNANWQNQNSRNQGFGDNRFNQPSGPGNDTRNRGDFGSKRSFNLPNDGGDSKRNKLETNSGDGNKWQGGNQQKPKWEPPANQPERWTPKPAESAPKHNPEELTEAEKKFDRQFADWESQFQKWKEQNANHPDKEQYREYEKKWEAWRTQLLDRREQMRRKRLGLTGESPQPATDKPSPPKPENDQEKPPVPSQAASQVSPHQSQTGPFPLIAPGKPSLLGAGPQVPPSTGKPGLLGFSPLDARLDQFGKPPSAGASAVTINLNRLPPSLNDQPLDFKKSRLEFGEEQSGSELLGAKEDAGDGFLKSASTGGIPGLDLVKDGKEEAKTDEESENQKPDLEAISRGINSILGDQKLMNMLSMVSQTQNRPTASPSVNTIAPIQLESPKFSPEPAQDDYSNEENAGFYENQNDGFSNADEQTRSSFNVRNDPEGLEFDNFGKPDEFGGGNDDFHRGLEPFNRGPNNFNADANNWNRDNFNRGPDNFNRGPDNFNRAPDNFNRGPDHFNRGPDHFNRGPDNFNRGPDNFNKGPDNFNKGPDNFNRGPDSFNRGPDNFNKGPDTCNKGPDTFNKGPDNVNRGPDNFNKGLDTFNKGPGNFNKGPDNFNRGSDSFNRGPDDFNRADNFNRGRDNFNRGLDNFNKGPDNFNRGPDNFNRGPDNFRGSDNFNRGADNFNRGGPDKFNRGPDNFNKGLNFNRDSDNFEEDPDELFNRGSSFNRGPDNFNREPDNFNRGPGRFNRGPNNFDRNSDGFNRGPDNFDRGSADFNQDTDGFNRDARGPNSFNKGPDTFNRGNNEAFKNFNMRAGSRDFEDESDGFGRKPDNFREPGMAGSFDEESNSFDREQDDCSGGSQNVDKSGFNRNLDNLNNAVAGRFQPPPLMEWNRNNSLPNDPIPPQPQELKDKAVVPVPEEQIWKPNSVIDYDHKSIKPAEPEVIVAPIYAFDYRHKPLNRIPYPQRPRWLLNMVKNYPEFDSAIPRPFDQQLRRYPVNERFDSRLTDSYQKYEDRNRKFFDERDRKPFNERERVPFEERDRKPFLDRERAPFEDRDRKPFADRERAPFEDHDRKPFADRERAPFEDRDRKPFADRERAPFEDRDRKPFGDRERAPFEDRDRKPFGDRERVPFEERDRKPFADHSRKPYDDRDRKPYDDRNRKSSDDWERKPYDSSSRKPFDDRRSRDFGDRRLPDDQNMFADKKPYGRDSENSKSNNYMEHEDENNSMKDKAQTKQENVDEESFNIKTVPIVPSKSQVTVIEDLLCPPGRYNRPPRIVIILRGPPGSGKSFLAKLIKDKEVENGGSAPRILCLDDYFMVEQEKEVEEDGRKVKVKEMIYEFEECMEASYRLSLMKSFKKTITDGYFNFIIVDNINDKVKYFGEMWSYAKQNGFQVYICQMELDVQTCTKRNVHGRSEVEIDRCVAGWEPTPSHHPVLDATGLIQSGSIPEVEMEEINSPPSETMNEEEHLISSKWDTIDYSVDKLAKLDGTNKPLRTSRTMEDYLQLDDDWVQPVSSKPGQKRVRWADLEERKEQEKMRAIGFVVGQTNWDRMMDPTMGSRALTQTKYIERYS